MNRAWLIAGRELRGYLRSPLGYIIIAAALLIDGLLYYAFALGSGPRLSADVLRDFFMWTSGTTAIAALFLSMRLLAEERQAGTLVLLNTSPVRDSEIIAGKFLSAYLMVSILTLLTLYMPALIFVNGKVSVGHIVVGYVGLLLFNAATVSIGLFGSALARNQILALVIGALLMGALTVLWMLAKVADPPLNDFLAALAIHNVQQRPFMDGRLELGKCIYYVAVTYFFLLASTKTLEARRWR